MKWRLKDCRTKMQFSVVKDNYYYYKLGKVLPPKTEISITIFNIRYDLIIARY